MQIHTTITALRQALTEARATQQRVAFVPTMGNLHEGHLQLVRAAKKQADIVVVSIFVNPLQFGANEDLDNYPRTFDADCEKLVREGVALLFFPDVAQIYPEGMDAHSKVLVPILADTLCGANRPGHFNGVSTIVTKLFQIVQPDMALFGKKDFQQLAIIRKMVNDLCMPLEIIGIDTERAADGLALSSRNGYLSAQERTVAPALYRALQQCRNDILEGSRDFALLEQRATRELNQLGFVTDYFAICDARSLQPAGSATEALVILAAAKLGETRLIDNLEV